MKRAIILAALISFACSVFAAQVTDFTMNGAVLKEKKGDSEIWEKTDGTIITVFKNRSEAKLPDGSRIVKYPDGRREAYSIDGQVIRIDGTRGTREYEGGKKTLTMKFDGMTPFGDRISRVEKTIQKVPLVRLIYLSERSDEVLDPGSSGEPMIWEIKIFFDALFDKIRQKYINAANEKNAYTGYPYDIQVSFCRYCSTGYCFGKQGGVTIEFVNDGKIKKSFFLGRAELREKEKREALVQNIVDSAPAE